MEKKRIPSIDFIRVISALYLVLYHYVCAFNTLPLEKVLKPIASCGYIGVEVFFMLSGFCMALNYKDSEKKFASYIYYRISPWYISYVCAVLLNFVLQAIQSMYLKVRIFPLDKPLSFHYLLTSLLLVHNGWFLNQNSPYGSGAWFLDVLVLLYILFFFIKKITGKRNELFIILCFLMVIVGWYFSNKPADFMFCYEKSARGYLTFFIGVLLHELYKRLNYESGKKLSYFFGGADLVIILLTGFFAWRFHANILGQFKIFMSVWFIPSVIFVCIFLFKNFRFSLSSSLVKYITSIYIWHALVLAEIEIVRIVLGLEWDYASWIIFIMVMLIILVQCVLFYYLIEKKFTRFMNKKISETIVFNTIEYAQA